MEAADNLPRHGASVAAPTIFFTVFVFHLVSRYIDLTKKMESKTMSATEVQLRAEIKQLLKEASSFSQPSTFAQAAKLRRLAAAKEKELANYQGAHDKKMELSYDSYLKILFILKVVTYFLLVCWFWRTPVTTISQQLVQPFGKFLSWRTGGHVKNNVMRTGITESGLVKKRLNSSGLVAVAFDGENPVDELGFRNGSSTRAILKPLNFGMSNTDSN